MPLLLRLVLGLLPVLSFLAALTALDSFKLVRPRLLLLLLAGGGLAAGLALLANRQLLAAGVPLSLLTHWLGPAAEELAKMVVLALVALRRRIGFLVDGAICGFAIGAGFAAVENLHYLAALPSSDLVLWVVRGFGTALMHGSVTAAGAVLARLLVDRGAVWPVALGPGWLAAVLVHALFNHFFLAPDLSTVLVMIVAPAFFAVVYRSSEAATRAWLGAGFDSDAELLGLITAGRVGQSRVGAYLLELRGRLSPEVVADMVCLLRLRLELSIRAKGILLAREAGLVVPAEPELRERFAELRYLEAAIGATGLRALKPVFHMSDRDLWQYHLLAGG